MTHRQTIATGSRQEAASVVAAWNSNPELHDDLGPATLRFRPQEGGWIATYTRWA